LSYRKFKANYLFTGKDLLDNNFVLITDENGIIKNILDEKEAGDDVQIFEGIISPGFINCHCHLELSHMKNVIESGTGLIDFLIKVVSKRDFLKEEIEVAAKAADEEMYKNGIVAVGDISNTTDSLGTKIESKIYYQNFIEVLGFNEERAQIVFDNYLKVYNAFCDAGFIKNTSIVPHAPYTISTTLFNLINNFSAEKIISIHNQETLAEDELYQTKTGDFFRLYHHLNINTDFFQPYNKSSLQSYLSLLDKAKNVLLIHNTFTNKEDIDFAEEQSIQTCQQIFWCLCANANLYIENKLPPVELLQQNNCNIVLGTDSYSSNWSLNILDEMKTLQKNFSSISLKELLQWVTINGATAINIQDRLGSFEKGKQPGAILINNISNKNITEESLVSRLL
jgi:cytosine/adenosine deaminase-related metal-dependent hydrolase